MEEEVFRFRSVFVRETRVERASRGACDLTILSRWGVLIGVEVEKALECTGPKRGQH